MSQHNPLRTTVLGIPVASPVLIGSGPLTDQWGKVQHLLGCCAGAVVLKTIYAGPPTEDYEGTRRFRSGALNSVRYSRRPLDEWIGWIEQWAEASAPVIPSIHACSAVELGRLAETLVEHGARALELGIACPTDGSHSVATAAYIEAAVGAVRRRVTVPIAVKLTAVSDLVELGRAAESAGADALTISDALPAVAVSVRERRLVLGSEVGYSGPGIKPIVLRGIVEVRRVSSLPILGVGGIGTAEDVLQYLLIGCQAVQTYTAVLANGSDLVERLTVDLVSWCDRHETTIVEITGGLRRDSYAKSLDATDLTGAMDAQTLWSGE